MLYLDSMKRWLVTARYGESEYVSHRFDTYRDAMQAYMTYSHNGWVTNITSLDNIH